MGTTSFANVAKPLMDPITDVRQIMFLTAICHSTSVKPRNVSGTKTKSLFMSDTQDQKAHLIEVLDFAIACDWPLYNINHTFSLLVAVDFNS